MGNEGQSPELGKNRIEALSDGIFAVAMTLLIFEFHVPDLPHTASNILVAPALLHLWPKFVTYAVSFLSLGVFWIGHHNMYHAVRRADRVLLGLSILFFMFVAFLPFSTSVLNAFMETQVGLLFFGANLTIIGWLLFLQWAYATSQPSMMAEFVTPEHRSRVRFRFVLYPVVVTLTMLLCFWSVPISLAIYLLLLPVYVIPSAAQQVPLPPRGRKKVSRGVVLGAVGVVVIVAGWAAFRPELLFVNKRTSEAFPAQPASGEMPTALLAGRLHGVAHPTTGVVSLYRLPSGTRVLRLTDFRTSNGPDVRVYLIVAPDATDNETVTGKGYIEVSRLKANEGDQNYVLASNIDLSRYHAATIWCNRFHVNFATAPLAAPPKAGA